MKIVRFLANKKVGYGLKAARVTIF